MSAVDNTEEGTVAVKRTDGLRPWAFIVGGALAALGISGLLDDSGVLQHPAWLVPAAAVIAGCTCVVAITGHKLTS